MATSPKLVSSTSSAELRKIKKPLIEKKRRERINQCLAELKILVLEAKNKNESCYSKMEKADILEMTVAHLKDMQAHSKYPNTDENLIAQKPDIPASSSFVKNISNDDRNDFNDDSSNNTISISVTKSEIKSESVHRKVSIPSTSQESKSETLSNQFATGYFECVRRVSDYLSNVEGKNSFKQSILKHLRKHLPSTLLRPKHTRLPTCVFLSNITNRPKKSKSTPRSSSNQTNLHFVPLHYSDAPNAEGQKKTSDPWSLRSNTQFDESPMAGINDLGTRISTNCIGKNPFVVGLSRLQAQSHLSQVWRPWNPN